MQTVSRLIFTLYGVSGRILKVFRSKDCRKFWKNQRKIEKIQFFEYFYKSNSQNNGCKRFLGYFLPYIGDFRLSWLKKHWKKFVRSDLGGFLKNGFILFVKKYAYPKIFDSTKNSFTIWKIHIYILFFRYSGTASSFLEKDTGQNVKIWSQKFAHFFLVLTVKIQSKKIIS